MGRLTIEALPLNLKVGVYDHEKLKPQKVLVDLELSYKDPKTDDISEVVDYDNLVSRIRSLIESKSYNLIETVASDIVRICSGIELVDHAQVRVKKQFLPTTGVSYSICYSK